MINTSGFTHESPKAKTVEWYTPPSVFEALNTEFDLDTCSPEGGIPWIPAKKYLTKKEDGLVTPWDGFVWCNPPYGKATAVWLEKMQKHNNGIALVFSRTDCKWFHDYVATADVILFKKGRISFIDIHGNKGDSGAGNGSIFIGYGVKAKQVLQESNIEGVIYYGKKY